MIPRSFRVPALLAAALLLPACIEADIETEVRADGTGTFGMRMKFTEKTVEVIRRLETIDPEQDIVKQTREGPFDKVTPERIAAMEKAGLKVLEAEAFNDEKRIEAKVRVEFRTLAGLAGLDALDREPGASGPADDMALTRDDKGVYTLRIRMESDKKEEAKAGPAAAKADPEAKEGAEPPAKPDAAPKDPEAERKKMAAVMAAMGELMGEAQKLRISVALKVPGEIVDFAPAAGGKKEEGRVVWSMTFQTMMEAAMSGGDKDPMEEFQVRFKLPEGQSIPEAALLAPKAPPAPAPAAAPAAEKKDE